MAIIVVFIVAWGVAEFGLLFPHTAISGWTIRDILIVPYFQMIPELYAKEAFQSPPFDMIHEGDCTDDPELYGNYTQIRCSDKRTNWIAVIFLTGYILLTNVLVYNLLIAIFAATFEAIHGIH